MSRSTPRSALAAILACVTVSAGGAQGTSDGPLTLGAARARARAISPAIRAAEAAAEVGRGQARQVGAAANPLLSWTREQVSRLATTSTQDIVVVEQRVDVAGVRSARQAAARLHAESNASLATLAAVEVDYQVAASYARLVAAEHRVEAVARMAADFQRAMAVSRTRLEAGDVSAYADRRLTVEAAGLAVRAAQVGGDRTAATASLLALLAGPGGPVAGERIRVDTVLPPPVPVAADSLVALALARRGDLRALESLVDAGRVELAIAHRERAPTVAATLGYKRERSGAAPFTLSGVVAGLAVPLPLWDRRSGAIEAAEAESRRRAFDRDAQRLTVRLGVLDALAQHRAAAAVMEQVSERFLVESADALAAIDVAYAEGEASLIEWLDAKRAMLDLELLRADAVENYLMSRAALERAVADPLTPRIP